MAKDVENIVGLVNGVKPLAAARLCNFPTGGAKPLAAHFDWINSTFANAVKDSPNPWVDIYAYASKRGSATGYDNQGLSEHRRIAVHKLVMTAAPRAGLIKQDVAFGASRSTGNASDNDGYWRAVEVYAYGNLPGKRQPDPHPPPKPVPPPAPAPATRPDWWVSSLSVGGLSLVIEVGGGFADGTIVFENIASGERPSDHIRIGGVSVGASEGLNKLNKVAELLAKSPVAKKAMDWVINALSGGREKWRSEAAGPVFPMPGHSNLAGADFKGTCLAVFVNGAAGPVNSGFYVIFMGKQESLAHFIAWLVGALAIPAIGPAVLASTIVNNSHAVAIVPAYSLGAGAAVGVSLNIWVGRIS